MLKLKFLDMYTNWLITIESCTLTELFWLEYLGSCHIQTPPLWHPIPTLTFPDSLFPCFLLVLMIILFEFFLVGLGVCIHLLGLP